MVGTIEQMGKGVEAESDPQAGDTEKLSAETLRQLISSAWTEKDGTLTPLNRIFLEKANLDTLRGIYKKVIGNSSNQS
jgi:hypothetical protein